MNSDYHISGIIVLLCVLLSYFAREISLGLYTMTSVGVIVVLLCHRRGRLYVIDGFVTAFIDASRFVVRVILWI